MSFGGETTKYLRDWMMKSNLHCKPGPQKKILPLPFLFEKCLRHPDFFLENKTRCKGRITQIFKQKVFAFWRKSHSPMHVPVNRFFIKFFCNSLIPWPYSKLVFQFPVSVSLMLRMLILQIWRILNTKIGIGKKIINFRKSRARGQLKPTKKAF